MPEPSEPDRMERPRLRGPAPTSVRRVEGPTPHGGAYTVIAEHAGARGVQVEITEFDHDDQVIFRAYGRREKGE